MKPPALAWKKKWPVSARLSVDSVMLVPSASESIAGSRDCVDHAAVARERDRDRLPDDLRIRPGQPVMICRSLLSMRVVLGGRQGPCVPSGLQPIVSSVAVARSVTKTRVSCGPVVPATGLIGRVAQRHERRPWPSGEIAMSTARTRPASDRTGLDRSVGRDGGDRRVHDRVARD